MAHGLNIRADAVKITLGPKGRNVVASPKRNSLSEHAGKSTEARVAIVAGAKGAYQRR